MQLSLAGAVVVGSVGGGLVALATSPANHARPVVGAGSAPPTAAGPAQPPAAAPAAPQPTAFPPPRVEPDPHDVLAAAMTTVLTRFADWARDHAGAPCPDAAALNIVALDPWNRPLELTCSDQPADQRIGLISAGPDGIAGNADDIASWSLGREVTTLVRGPRWKPAATTTRTRSVRPRRDATSAAPTPPSASTAPTRQPGPPTGIHAPASAPPATPASAPPATPASAPPATPVPTSSDGGDDIPSRRSPR